MQSAEKPAGSLLEIETDFEKKIARIMPDMALSKTGNSWRIS
jgi:hypothetical protein